MKAALKTKGGSGTLFDGPNKMIDSCIIVLQQTKSDMHYYRSSKVYFVAS